MVDWSTVASLATAGGTLVLALATFVSLRSANRATRVAEYGMQIGIRPLLMPSRLEDPIQKIMWGDEHWARLSGGGANVEVEDGNVYLAMSLRNSGSGIAVIQGWHLGIQAVRDPHPHAEPDEFRPQSRDLYVPGGTWGSGKEPSGTATIPSTRISSRPSSLPASSRSSCSTPTRRRPTHDRALCARAPWRLPMVGLDGPALEPRPTGSSVTPSARGWRAGARTCPIV